MGLGKNRVAWEMRVRPWAGMRKIGGETGQGCELFMSRRYSDEESAGRFGITSIILGCRHVVIIKHSHANKYFICTCLKIFFFKKKVLISLQHVNNGELAFNLKKAQEPPLKFLILFLSALLVVYSQAFNRFLNRLMILRAILLPLL